MATLNWKIKQISQANQTEKKQKSNQIPWDKNAQNSNANFLWSKASGKSEKVKNS